jgi:glucose/arabinose dehydrogenase
MPQRMKPMAALAVSAWTILMATTAEAQRTGQELYEQTCAACHDGGDETAPERKTLASMTPATVLKALGPGGLMAGPGSLLSATEREALASFLTQPVQAAASTADAGRPDPDYYVSGIPYPARRIADPRDRADAPRAPAWTPPPLAAGVYDVESWEERNLRITVMATGLSSPRAIEFLPEGDMLITERAGALRIVRGGVLASEPVRGTPAVAVLGTATGFMDIALHPKFSENGFIYLSYHKPAFGKFGVNAIYRGRWNGREIVEGRDIFVSDDVDALYSRLHFGPDGKLYATIGCPGVGTDASISRAQDPSDFAGKTLRLNDDGTTPADNPFVNVKGYNPQIYTLGHRVNLGLTLNPWTGEFWVSEHGPQGGDEINILRPGLNYGWPLISDGRYYSGSKVSEIPYREGLTRPHMSYVPSIAPGGMIFYTGDKFPAWKGNLFVGSMRMSNAPRTGHLERIVFNDRWEVVRSEMLLSDFHQRIRDVEQGPDGAIYVITDEGTSSAVIKIEPGSSPGETAPR